MISEAAASGDRRLLLVALRDRLAAEIDAGVEAKELPGLVLRLERIAAELDGMPGAGRDSIGDALAARRKAKKAASG